MSDVNVLLIDVKALDNKGSILRAFFLLEWQKYCKKG